jgi:hypothetical protein
MLLLSAFRWIAYNLAPGVCPDCGGLLSPVLHKSARQVGAILPPDYPDFDTPGDWLCCEDCDYALALDLPAATS